MPGLFNSPLIIERTATGAVSAANFGTPFVAPCDLDFLGLVGRLATAAGGGDKITINVSISPTSQLAKVSAYNAWTATNVPSITDPATQTDTVSTSTTVVSNRPYAVNYPLPGDPNNTTGYVTAQSTSQTTETPVTSPPLMNVYEESALVAPDNTYTDFNGVTQPATWVHTGDLLQVVVAGTVGSAAGLSVSLLFQKH